MLMRNFTLFKNMLWLALAFVAGNAMAQTNLLSNAGFEDWADGTPAEWTPTTTAGSATLSQSTEAYEGSYSVLVTGTSSTNKRLAYKEITLKAGTYTFAFYAKSATSELASIRPGYVPVVDGVVQSTGYKYGAYANDLSNTEWTLVSYEFTLAAETTVNLVVMNSKTPGKDVLIDSASLTTDDGGLVEGGETPDDPNPVETYSYKKATTIESGKSYLIVAETEGVYKVALPILTKNYGYLQVTDATADGENITLTSQANEFVFTATEGGYTIMASDSRYLYQTGTYNSFNVNAAPEDGQVWTVEANADGTFKITNVSVNKYVQYSVGYKSYGSYADEQGLMPYLYELVTGEGGGDAIANVEAEAENAPVEVYTLGGVKVGNSLNGLAKGIYVVKQGNQVKKVMK